MAAITWVCTKCRRHGPDREALSECCRLFAIQVEKASIVVDLKGRVVDCQAIGREGS